MLKGNKKGTLHIRKSDLQAGKRGPFGMGLAKRYSKREAEALIALPAIFSPLSVRACISK